MTASFQILTSSLLILSFKLSLCYINRAFTFPLQRDFLTWAAVAPSLAKVVRRRTTHQQPLLSCGVGLSRGLPASTNKQHNCERNVGAPTVLTCNFYRRHFQRDSPLITRPMRTKIEFTVQLLVYLHSQNDELLGYPHHNHKLFKTFHPALWNWSWGSSVSIVPDYRLGDRGSTPGKGFFL
jgi:hypothetical protein